MTSARRWSARAAALLLAAAGLFILVCLLAYDPRAVPLLSSEPGGAATHLGGTLGAWLGFAGRGFFGWASLGLPLLLAFWALRCWRAEAGALRPVPATVGALGLIGSAATLLGLGTGPEALQAERAGVVGMLLARAGAYYLGLAGTILTAVCVGALSWMVVSGSVPRLPLRVWWARLRARRGRAPEPPLPARAEPAAVPPSADRPRPPIEEPAPYPEPRVRIRPPSPPKPRPVVAARGTDGFQLPSVDLLTTPPPIAERRLAEDLQANARILEETLRDFGIEARVVNIDRGPVVTRYELTPSPGVKLTRIVSLADDIALVMKAASCHIVAPIPGKGTVGIDVPNSSATIVFLKEILTAPECATSRSPLALPIGKDVSGEPVVVELSDCPHLLIAGATGSGKTVCLNSLLVGLLTRATPEQVRFLMIDPKMVELAMFNEIPHLVAPVVTTAKRASAALHWAVQEMERRYQLFAAAGVRNIQLYNARARKATGGSAGGEQGTGEVGEGPLPYLVIVIDELADLMMVAAQDVEGAIARLAQLSRAVGLHMVLATQRPSVDVITGVIKANFPARIAFQVASKVDSRTILDANGADKLLGRGDLLFLRPGSARLIRAQGAYVTDAEIERVVGFVKAQRAPEYDEGLLESQQPRSGGIAGERDELYEQAKRLVLATGQASTSLLQRRLRLGYGRAARILDLMEQEGLVGPPQGSRPREVLAGVDSVKSGE